MQITQEHVAYNEYTKKYTLLGDADTYKGILDEIRMKCRVIDFDFITVIEIDFHKGTPVGISHLKIKSDKVTVPEIDFSKTYHQHISQGTLV